MYIKTNCYGGACHQDMATTKDQLELNGSYNIPKEKVDETIVEYLVQLFPFMNKQIFEDAIKNKVIIQFPIKVRDEENETLWLDCETKDFDGETYYEQTLTFDGKERILLEEYCWGQATYETKFIVEDIPKEKVVFLVEECFINPYKYCDIIERIYVAPFKEFDLAKKYFDTLVTHDINGCTGVKKIFVANEDVVKATSWYELNMNAIKLMEDREVSIDDDSYQMSVTSHIESLKTL